MAGPWLQGEFPPLAVAAFAALLLYWDSGYGAGQIGYVLLIAAAGLGLLWVEAIGTLMVPIASVLVWSLVLLGLVLFAYVTRHVVDRNLVTQSGRQGSLLAAVIAATCMWPARSITSKTTSVCPDDSPFAL